MSSINIFQKRLKTGRNRHPCARRHPAPALLRTGRRRPHITNRGHVITPGHSTITALTRHTARTPAVGCGPCSERGELGCGIQPGPIVAALDIDPSGRTVEQPQQQLTRRRRGTGEHLVPVFLPVVPVPTRTGIDNQGVAYRDPTVPISTADDDASSW